MILAADIGGTKSLFALWETTGSSWRIIYLRQYPSRSFTSLKDVIENFLADYASTHGCAPDIEVASFGMAATITNESCFLVNLGWTVEIQSLKERFPKIRKILVCNDLEATGYGLELLPSRDLHMLTPARQSIATDPPTQRESRRAIIAPGTGLGEAFLLGNKVISSEGSHCEFGPRSEIEVKLWRFFHEIYDHVSYERILSGPGLFQLERFVRQQYHGEASDSQLQPEDITRLALSGECAICQQALDHFVGILGAEAGNLALKFLAMDGVYLAGGIPPKILPKLQEGFFLRSFCAKGRYSELMTKIPVSVVLNPHTALYGATSLAAQAVHPGIKPVLITAY